MRLAQIAYCFSVGALERYRSQQMVQGWCFARLSVIFTVDGSGGSGITFARFER
jgi:hypothetical protein